MNSFVAVLIVSPVIGSFLGVLIARLPEGRPVAWTRSACGACGTSLGWRDLVPILSFLLLHGRCRHCGAPIGRFHLQVELAALAIGLLALLAEGDGANLWATCILGWVLLALAWIDARTMLLPDLLTLPLLATGLAATWVLDADAIADHTIASAVAAASFLAIGFLYRAIRKRDGLGMGDAKLMGVAGAWLGLEALPNVVLIAALLGLAWAGATALRGQQMTARTALPFGPFLAAAIWAIRLLDIQPLT